MGMFKLHDEVELIGQVTEGTRTKFKVVPTKHMPNRDKVMSFMAGLGLVLRGIKIIRS
jgi:hypothetical protein